MTDEKYIFTQDVRDKKTTARSARYRRTHNGKGGSVKLPSDYMTKKEIQAMNGKAESYRINAPMKWAEYKALPEDLKVVYIKAIREKYRAPYRSLADMFGVSFGAVAKEMSRLGFADGEKGRRYKWDKEGFLAWCNGVPVRSAEPKEKAEPIEEAQETAIAEEVALNEPDEAAEVESPVQMAAIPCYGSMNFNCSADAALKTVANLLGGANVRISITWELLDNG